MTFGIREDFESLGPIGFRALVGALVVRQYPTVRCYPLTGRDGGRDVAIRETANSSIVFQVKMKGASDLGRPTAKEQLDWLKGQARLERKKIEALQKRGATRWILATNIAGTGDLETGTQDKFEAWCADQFSLPVETWWREDIATRLRANFDVARTFGLLDNANLSLFDGLSRNGDVKAIGIHMDPDGVAEAAIYAYITSQYERDSKIRFRQADLDQADLLDNFIDVPVELGGDNRSKQWAFDMITSSNMVGAARYISGSSLMLHDHKDGPSAIFLEAGPGQGKSTLSQYVCQILRSRTLQQADDLAKIPSKLIGTQGRIPFRVELRLFAQWCTNAGDPLDKPNVPIFEYIAEQVSNASGLPFSANQLIQACHSVPTLLFFDGLDEVADLKLRSAITHTIEKLTVTFMRVDTRIVLSSRPSVFEGGAKLSDRRFVSVSLADLPQNLIDEYASNWLKLQQMTQLEAEEFLSILAGVLTESHVQILARNPMQLAILLWLIYSRGWSIPAKRSALYDAYIDTFLAREAQKDTTVRVHRDVLLELHAYLAWLMHTNAESAANRSGDMLRTELEIAVRSYLVKEDRDPETVTNLFKGVQRIFVLVENVEGRFEFSVQPLREYFAAKYIFSTSPQVPAYEARRGLRPDRMNALARNPYWSNVTRFFCGWYQKGELADLARALVDMINDESQRVSLAACELTFDIISDYTFASSKRDSQALIEALCANGRLRYLNLTQARSSRSFASINEETGLEFFAKELKDRLAQPSEPQSQDAQAYYAKLLGRCRTDLADWWIAHYKQLSTADERSGWLRVGSAAGALKSLSLSQLLSVFDAQSDLGAEEWNQVVENQLADIAGFSLQHWRNVLASLEETDSFFGTLEANWLGLALRALDTSRWEARAWLLQRRGRASAVDKDALKRYIYGDTVQPDFGSLPDAVREQIAPLLAALQSFPDFDEVSDDLDTFAWWRSNLEAIEDAWSRNWATLRIAMAGAELPRRTGPRRIANLVGLLDSTQSALDICWLASRRGNDVDYWKGLFASLEPLLQDMEKRPDVLRCIIAMTLSFAPADYVFKIFKLLDPVVRTLESPQLEALDELLSSRARSSPRRSIRGAFAELKLLSSVSLTLMAQRIDEDDYPKLLDLVFKRSLRVEPVSFVLSELLNAVSVGDAPLQRLSFRQRASVARRWGPMVHAKSYTSLSAETIAGGEYRVPDKADLRAAAKLRWQADLMPVELLNQSAALIRRNTLSDTRSVAAIASEERWFD